MRWISKNGAHRSRIACAIMLGVGAFFLLSEHRAHALGLLPYLLFLACPLMHLFHHGGHGHGHGSQGQQEPPDSVAKGRHE